MNLETEHDVLVVPAATLLSYDGLLTRDQLASIPTPDGTATHRPIPHHEVVHALVDTLGLCKIGVTKDQYAVSRDGNNCYWTMDLSTGFKGGNFTLGGRNSHDKKHAFGLTVGYRVAVCENGMFRGDYTPLMRKHTSKFNLQDALSIGVHNIMRNFEPLTNDIERWREQQLSDLDAKLSIYEVFIEERINLPKHLMRSVHDHYFNPPHEDFRDRTTWSLQNAYTGAIKALDPIPRQRAQVSIGQYFNKYKAGG